MGRGAATTEGLKLFLKRSSDSFMVIKLLSPDVSARIAAGEVIERPSSVVKELLENSLDANSSSIHINTVHGGLDSISIVDNGNGISKNEMGLAFERFATSKVETLDDLDSIGSLGFRGEAMYSIASVSNVELVSSISSDMRGSRIVVRCGEVIEHVDSAANLGTVVTVSGLFHNFPARRKYLRSPAVESGRIATLVQKYAMIRPDVGFRLVQQNSRPFSTTGSRNLREVLAAIYDHEFASEFLEIEANSSQYGRTGSSVAGLIGTPSQNRSNRSHINIFVNGRWIQNRTISYAFEQAYYGFMPERRFPMGVLDIRMPVYDVDVNVHPAKTEVRFKNENHIFGVVQQAIRRTLIQSAPVPVVSSRKPIISPHSASLISSDPSTFWPSSMTSGPGLSESVLLESTRTSDESVYGNQTFAEALTSLRVLGQVKNTYVVAEGPDGIYMVDQHAAHERIVFEEVVDRAREGRKEMQTLLEPVSVVLESHHIDVLKENHDVLDKLGMVLEPFGPDSYLIRCVPIVLSEADPTDSLMEILNVLSEGLIFESWEEKAAYSIACHGAIRAGKSLSLGEMQSLLRQLELCRQPHSCPHGRPTVINFSVGNLEREFGRRR